VGDGKPHVHSFLSRQWETASHMFTPSSPPVGERIKVRGKEAAAGVARSAECTGL